MDIKKELGWKDERELTTTEQYVIDTYGIEYFILWVKSYYRFDQIAFLEILKK